MPNRSIPETLPAPRPADSRPPASAGPSGRACAPAFVGTATNPIAFETMSKRTVKRKIRSKKKANHGKRPNAGRG